MSSMIGKAKARNEKVGSSHTPKSEESGNAFPRNFHLSEISLASTTSHTLSDPLHWLLYCVSITPIICGGIGPALTLLALSGCVDSWRALPLPDGSQFNEGDPVWVIVPTTIAIIIGVIANILLLVSMTGNRNPKHTKHIQYCAIILWILECTFPPHEIALMSAILNFVTIGVYVDKVGDDGEWAYAQGFWMTVCSAGMSSVCAFLLALNCRFLSFIGKDRKIALSPIRRAFVIRIMLFIIWLALYSPSFYGLNYSGAATFHFVEHLTFSESVYFTDSTICIVGFGDSTSFSIPF